MEIPSPFGTPRNKKRLRGTPTNLTPHQPSKRVPLRERVASGACVGEISLSAKVCLSFGGGGYSKWSEDEVNSLVEFILLMGVGEKWPTHHRKQFWCSAGEFVQKRTKSRHLRSGINYTMHCSMY